MINGINHVALASPDVDRLVAFYRDVLGFEVCGEARWRDNELIDEVIGVPNSAARTAILRAGNIYLEFFQYEQPATPADAPLRQPYERGYTHICLDVSDIEAEHRRLTAAGAVFNRAPPHFGEVGLRAVYGRDPDGNIIEIQETLTRKFGISLIDLPLLRRNESGLAAELADREEIRHKLHLYCRALDRVDEALLRSLFHPDSEHAHGPYQGPSSAFCGFAMAVLAELDGTVHQLSNVTIELDGTIAHAESYFRAVHLLAKGRRSAGVFAAHDPDKAEIVEIGGRYIDRWEKRQGVWKIARRTGVHDWENWLDWSVRGAPRAPAAVEPARDRSDPVYRREERGADVTG